MKHATWTESAVLQGFTLDGRTGFIVRVQRYPAKSRDWLWLHLFTPKRVHGFVEEHLPGTRDVLRVDGDDVGYRVGSERTPGGGVLQRRGPRTAPAGAAAFAYGKGHAGPDVPEGAGEVEMSLSAMLTPTHLPGASAKDRSEVLGVVTGTLDVAGKRAEIAGYGHWHEQHQLAPRFATPFTYLSLVGESLGLVAIRSPRGASGFVSRGGDQEAITKFEIGPAAERRRMVITTDGGHTFEFIAAAAHRYLLPIEGRSRKSSVVTANIDGEAVVGVANDWMDEELPPELPAL